MITHFSSIVPLMVQKHIEIVHRSNELAPSNGIDHEERNHLFRENE